MPHSGWPDRACLCVFQQFDRCDRMLFPIPVENPREEKAGGSIERTPYFIPVMVSIDAKAGSCSGIRMSAISRTFSMMS